jgi:Zn-dependent protease
VIDPFKPQLATRGGATGRATEVPRLRLRRVSRRSRPARVGLFGVSLFGVTLRLDVSWVFGLGLAAWTFADAVLPLDVPERTTTAYVTAGSVAALLVLGSLALHEAGHWLVARRAGLPVTRLALSLVGGTLELGAPPRTPASEVRIALAGPLASVLTAVVAGIAHVVLVESDADPLTASIAAVVAVANLAVALLNLLPGLPLDGGRVLKATIWAIAHDEARATHVATLAGRILAFALLALAVLASASGDAAAAIWSGALGLTLLR